MCASVCVHVCVCVCRLSKVARVAGAALPEGSADNKGGTTKGANRKGGLAALRLDPSLLEGDFDPEEWDRQMAAAFNDEYYVSHTHTHTHTHCLCS